MGHRLLFRDTARFPTQKGAFYKAPFWVLLRLPFLGDTTTVYGIPRRSDEIGKGFRRATEVMPLRGASVRRAVAEQNQRVRREMPGERKRLTHGGGVEIADTATIHAVFLRGVQRRRRENPHIKQDIVLPAVTVRPRAAPVGSEDQDGFRAVEGRLGALLQFSECLVAFGDENAIGLMIERGGRQP